MYTNCNGIFGYIAIKKKHDGNVEEPEWHKLYAAASEHLNIPPDKLIDYTIPQIEYLLEGWAENNKSPDDSSSEGKVIEGDAAIKFLMENQNGSSGSL